MFRPIIESYQTNGFLHHAYLIVGEKETAYLALIESLGIIEGTANTILEKYETFGIAESRELVSRSARHNWHGGREFVILIADRYTSEAQNALLKLFEEPRDSLHFFILGKQTNDFLPTLRSRMMVVEHDARNENKLDEEKNLAKEFLTATPIKRLDLIAKELKRELPREGWLPFLNALEIVCHEKRPLHEQALIEISAVRRYLVDPASSPRLLFEHLALVLSPC